MVILPPETEETYTVLLGHSLHEVVSVLVLRFTTITFSIDVRPVSNVPPAVTVPMNMVLDLLFWN